MTFVVFLRYNANIVKRTIQFHIYKGDKKYVAEGVDLPVVTEAMTLDELATNIQEAVALHLEGEKLSDWNLEKGSAILANVELTAAHA